MAAPHWSGFAILPPLLHAPQQVPLALAIRHGHGHGMDMEEKGFFMLILVKILEFISSALVYLSLNRLWSHPELGS